ncbi:hypothetical protein P692DRAFT_201122893 [Suillus brevipes Sb2]|nr:hypothetical protein P692DRAFT_201122893 [Suillus brevipes Sb2]
MIIITGQYYTVHEFAQATYIRYLCLANRSPIPHLSSLFHGDDLHVPSIKNACSHIVDKNMSMVDVLHNLCRNCRSLRIVSRYPSCPQCSNSTSFSALTPKSICLTKIEFAIDQMNAVLDMLHLCLNLSSFTIIASMKQQIPLTPMHAKITWLRVRSIQGHGLVSLH